MKLDTYYIESILNAVSDHPETSMFQNDLLSAIGSDAQKNPDEFKKFYHHMMRIKEARFLKCNNNENMGFYRSFFGFSQSGAGTKLRNIDYELTWEGNKYLEALNNDTIGEKAKQMLADMSIEQFKKKFPALISTLIGM